MNRIAVAGLLALMLGACKPMATAKIPSPDANKRSVMENQRASTTVDISNVEFAVHIKGTLDNRSKAPNITCDEMVNARYLVDFATITVHPPYPEQLWVMFDVSSTENFAETPIVLRTLVKMDNEEVDSFLTTLGSDARTRLVENSMDVMSKLDGMPDSVLIYAQAEALLLPEGTDLASIDPETVTVPRASTGAVISNPIKIKFVTEDAAAEEAEQPSPGNPSGRGKTQ